MNKSDNYSVMSRILAAIDIVFTFVILSFAAVNTYVTSAFEIVNLQDFLNSRTLIYLIFIISNFTLVLFPLPAIILIFASIVELIKFRKRKNDIGAQQYKRNLIFCLAITALTVGFVIYDVMTVVSGF